MDITQMELVELYKAKVQLLQQLIQIQANLGIVDAEIARKENGQLEKSG